MLKISRGGNLLRWGIQFLILIVATLVVYIVMDQGFPPAKPLLQPVASKQADKDRKQQLHYVAVGDSLTEGIGDQTKRGGFVPIVAEDIQSRYQLQTIEVDNFGISGERSDQILKRVKQDQELRNNLQDADFVTITVGGNDLMKVIRNSFFELTMKKFNKPRARYQERVTEIITEIRSLNTTVPIYTLGIYNPFYLNFPEITDMQQVVDDWNEATEVATRQFPKSYFIPINDLLYQGLDQEVGVAANLTSSEEAKTTGEDETDIGRVDNDVLYDEDKFHPNNIGYQLMANAVRDQLIATQNEWLKQGNEDSNE